MPNLWANPYLLAGAAGVLIFSHGAIYLQGRSDGGAIVHVKYGQAAEKAIRAMQRGARAIDSLDGAHALARSSQDNQNRSVRDAAISLLPRPIHGDSCVDADGVGLLDRAVANANITVDSSQHAGATPDPAADAARR